MTEEQTAQEKLDRIRANQSAAHRKWRNSDKGKAYYQRRKEQRALGKSPK